MQLAFDLGKFDMQVGRPVLTSDTGREVCLAVALQLTLHGNQKIFRAKMRGQQLGFRS